MVTSDQYVERLIWQYNLQPADVIVMKKAAFGLLDHYVVYLGRDRYTNKPVFAANYTRGTQYIWQGDIDIFLRGFQVERIEHFYGTLAQRDEAIERAISKIGETQYNYLANNCEHYKNFVQTGVSYSKQADNFVKNTFAVAGFFLFGAILNEVFSTD